MIIHSNDFILRSFTIEDTVQFYDMVNGDKSIEKYVPAAYTNSWQEVSENVEIYAKGDCINDFYLVIERDGCVIGAIIAVRTYGMTLDTSAIISNQYRGRGIMKEALKTFIMWLHTNTKYSKLSLYIRNDNISSRRLARKCNAHVVKEENDYFLYEIVI